MKNRLNLVYNCIKSTKKDKLIIKFMVCVLLFIIFYLLLKYLVGVPIFNVPKALKRTPEAVFIYTDRGHDVYMTTYHFVLFDNRELYTFYGICKYFNADKINDMDYMRAIFKSNSRYISKKDYETIMNWGWEANFYTCHNIPNESSRTQFYFYDNEIRVVDESDKKMIDSSEYIFTEIFNTKQFDFEQHTFYRDKIKWVYDGTKYRLVLFNFGYNGDPNSDLKIID